MTDRTERQKRDEATDARDELVEASEMTPPTVDQSLEEELATPAECESETAPTPIRSPKARRATRKPAAQKQARAAKRATPVDPEALRAAEDADRATTVIELESQGFSEDEALRLFDISKRLENSSEAREARRLRFTRWLVEQGILDEFSA